MAKLTAERGIHDRELQEYVRSAQTVTQKRDEWAAETGAPVKAVKTLTNMVGYGNSGEDWLLEHTVNTLPTDVKGIKKTLGALVLLADRPC